MKLTFLLANQAHVFMFGQQIITLQNEPMFYQTRQAAVEAAARHGLKVSKTSTKVTANDHGDLP